jgi:exonuclease III
MFVLTTTLGLLILCLVFVTKIFNAHQYWKAHIRIVGSRRIVDYDVEPKSKPCSIISTNIFCIPLLGSLRRITKMIQYLASNYASSIICMQELWKMPSFQSFPKGTRLIYAQNNGSVRISAGLAMLVPDRFGPIVSVDCHTFTSLGQSYDYWAHKGVLVVELARFFIVNTHMQSNEAENFNRANHSIKEVWKKQHQNLVQIVNHYNKFKPVLLCGDFNRDVHDFVVSELHSYAYPSNVCTHSSQGHIDGFFVDKSLLSTIGPHFYDDKPKKLGLTDHVIVGHVFSPVDE